MGSFDPRTITVEQLEKGVKGGKYTDFYKDESSIITEISRNGGGYVLKLVEYVPNTNKMHVQMDFIYDSKGNLIDKRLHKM